MPVLPERLVCEDEMLHKQVALAHLLEDSAPHVVVAELQPCARHGGVLVHDVAGIRRRGRVIVIGAPLHDYADILNLTRGMISAIPWREKSCKHNWMHLNMKIDLMNS